VALGGGSPAVNAINGGLKKSEGGRGIKEVTSDLKGE
jgi:hypothetical protein